MNPTAQQLAAEARKPYSAAIKALSAIVSMPATDRLYDLDAIPRDPVMEQVRLLRGAIDALALPTTTQAGQLDEARAQLAEEAKRLAAQMDSHRSERNVTFRVEELAELHSAIDALATQGGQQAEVGTPSDRLRWLLNELEIRFPGGDPFSSVGVPELGYIKAIDEQLSQGQQQAARSGVPNREIYIEAAEAHIAAAKYVNPRPVAVDPHDLLVMLAARSEAPAQLVGYVGSHGEILASTQYRGEPLKQGDKVYVLAASPHPEAQPIDARCPDCRGSEFPGGSVESGARPVMEPQRPRRSR